MNSIKSGLLIMVFAVLTGLNVSIGQMVPPVKSDNYFQGIKTDMQIPAEAGTNVLKLFSTGESQVAVTSNGVFRYRDGYWSGEAFGSGWRTAAVDQQGSVWLASIRTIQKEIFKIAPVLNEFTVDLWYKTEKLPPGEGTAFLT